jgi:RNA polymerase sigma factor (sigma-70 family)
VVCESVSLQKIVKRYAGLLNYSRQLWARKPHSKSSAANRLLLSNTGERKTRPAGTPCRLSYKGIGQNSTTRNTGSYARQHLVRRALEKLPANFREVLVLREVEGKSYREIAEITGMPAGTVMSNLSRARGSRTALQRRWSSLKSVHIPAGPPVYFPATGESVEECGVGSTRGSYMYSGWSKR